MPINEQLGQHFFRMQAAHRNENLASSRVIAATLSEFIFPKTDDAEDPEDIDDIYPEVINEEEGVLSTGVGRRRAVGERLYL